MFLHENFGISLWKPSKIESTAQRFYLTIVVTYDEGFSSQQSTGAVEAEFRLTNTKAYGGYLICY